MASLTTVNTPHRGCKFADWMMEKAPDGMKEKLAAVYNKTLIKFGDKNPDFIAAVSDLTAENCRIFEDMNPPEGTFCQSVGSKLNRAINGKFPLNLTYHFVRHFDGCNDGLVGEESFLWGEKHTFLTTPEGRGISHGDMIDLSRENIPDFDVREFYVQLVADLKNRGL